MKNLKINKIESAVWKNVEGADEFAVNVITDEIVISTKTDLLVFENFQDEVGKRINWEYERRGVEVVNLSCRTDGSQIVAILADGRSLIVDGDEVTELEVCEIVNLSTTFAEWSADEQILAIADNCNLFLVDSSLIPFSERSLLFSENERKSAPVNVGWGSEMTQFRGSAGKIKHDQIEQAVVKIKPHSQKSAVHWREDGEIVAVSFFDQSKEQRLLSIFDKNGQVISTMDTKNIILSHCFAHKPNRNLICSAVQNSDGYDNLAFFEKNGEQRNGFEVKWSRNYKNNRIIENISWNSTGSILGIQIKNQIEHFLEFWSLSNYEFTKKFTWKLQTNEEIIWRWSTVNETTCRILLNESKMIELNISTTSSFNQKTFENVVLASDELRISHLSRKAIPPPMCETSINVGESDPVGFWEFGREWLLGVDGKLRRYSIDGKVLESLNLPEEVVKGIVVQFCYEETTDSFVVWSHSDAVDILFRISRETQEIVEKKFSKIRWIGINSKTGKAEFANDEGEFFEFERNEKLFQIGEFEAIQQVLFLENHHVILTDDSSLYLNSTKIANNITSILARSSDVMLINFDNELRFINNEEGKITDEIRSVEAGSELIACDPKSANVVLQAARGNLETIQPRRYVMENARQLLDTKKYIEAFKWMKKHRIDMSYAMEYDGENLSNDAKQWLKSTTDSALLEQMIVSCTERFDAEKGNSLCKTVHDLVWNDEDLGRKTKLFPLLLTTLLRSSPAKVNEALQEINEHAKNVADRKDVFIRQSLHHVSFFVPAKHLFNCALSTYDLKLAQQVGEASNYDPKEYLPVLNRLNKIKCPLEQQYEINVVRESWIDAIRSLFQLDNTNENVKWWDDAREIIQREGLYQEVLEKLQKPADKRYRNCCELYAAELEKKIHWKQAALFYELAQNFEKSFKCWEMSRDVDGMISAARRMNIDVGKLKISALKLSVTLKEAKMYRELSKCLKIAGNTKKQVVRVLCEGQEWETVLKELNEQVLGTGDDVESEIKNAVVGRAEIIEMEIERRQTEFERYTERLKVVRETKLKRVEKFAAGEVEDLRDDISQISSISSRSGSSKVSMASSVRKRKQIDRKKASLKEGGEYEDSALLNTIAESYKYMEQIRTELRHLMPLMVIVGEIAKSLELMRECDAFSAKLIKQKNSIWPESLPIQCLPGPLYALFDANQEPSPIPMPPVFRLEPEMIAPSSNLSESIFP